MKLVKILYNNHIRIIYNMYDKKQAAEFFVVYIYIKFKS